MPRKKPGSGIFCTVVGQKKKLVVFFKMILK